MHSSFKTLIIDDDEFLREGLSFLCQNSFQAEVIEASSGSEGLTKVLENPDLDCIITDMEMPQGSGEWLIGQLHSLKSEIPVIICTGNSDALTGTQENYPHYMACIEKPNIHKPLISLIESLLLLRNLRERELCRLYTPISLQSLLQTGLIKQDLYLKLSERKFIKVMIKSDLFGDDDFKRFTAKNVTKLYALTQNVTPPAAAFPPFEDDIIVLSERTQKLIRSACQKFGITPEIQILIHANINLITKTLKQTPTLWNLFQQRKELDSENYFSTMSTLLTYVSCGIAQLLGWTSDLTRYKLALASMLHDISLTDPRLAIMNASAEMALHHTSYLQEELQSFEKHPEQSATLIQGLPDFPKQVDTIIRQHHERPNGSGFPEKLPEKKIDRLASVFIVAQQLTFFMNQGKTGERSIQDFLSQLRPEYQTGQFQKIYGLLKALE